MNDEILIIMLENGMNLLSKIKNQTEELGKIAIQFNPISFLDIKVQTQELCNLIVEIDGRFIKYIKDEFKTEELCLKALNTFYTKEIYNVSINNLIMSKNLNEDINTLLQFIDNQTIEICKTAVKYNYDELEFVKEQTEELIEYSISNYDKYKINNLGDSMTIGNLMKISLNKTIKNTKSFILIIRNLNKNIIKLLSMNNMIKCDDIKKIEKYFDKDIIKLLIINNIIKLDDIKNIENYFDCNEQECIICSDVKKYFIAYDCHETHICCLECRIKNNQCYYRCNNNFNNILF